MRKVLLAALAVSAATPAMAEDLSNWYSPVTRVGYCAMLGQSIDSDRVKNGITPGGWKIEVIIKNKNVVAFYATMPDDVVREQYAYFRKAEDCNKLFVRSPW